MTMVSSVNFGCSNGIVGTPQPPKTTGEVLKDWTDERKKETLEDLREKEQNGTITKGEKTYLNLTRALDSLGTILKPTVIFMNDDKNPVSPLTKGALSVIQPKPLNPNEVDPIIKDLKKMQFEDLCKRFEELKKIVKEKRENGTVTRADEYEINAVAMMWLIEKAKETKVNRIIEKRVEQGLKPAWAEEIKKLPLSVQEGFTITDKNGNYLIPTKVLNNLIPEDSLYIFNAKGEKDENGNFKKMELSVGSKGTCSAIIIKLEKGTDDEGNIRYDGVIRQNNASLHTEYDSYYEKLNKNSGTYHCHIYGQDLLNNPVKMGDLSELQ